MNRGWFNRCRFDIHPFNGLTGSVERIVIPAGISFIIVSVKRGSIDLWFGEFSSGTPLVPHLHFGQTNAPEWVPVPNAVSAVTIRLEDLTNPSLRIYGSVILGGE